MSLEYQEIVKSKEVLRFSYGDTVQNHAVFLLSDKKDNPKLFYSEIETPVCADGECKLAKIKVYWNLLGNYVGYGIYPKNPLTKNEHDPFTKGDYLKLHQLLSDSNSILKRKKMEDLIDEIPVSEEELKTYKGIDALSGATKNEIKESVVKGGLYTCFTLWHLIHGEVRTTMKHYLKGLYADSLITYFLNSQYQDYQDYAVKQLSKEEFFDHKEAIFKIFSITSPINRAYILKKIPDNLLLNESVTIELYNLFTTVDTNTKTELVNKMNVAHSSCIDILSIQVSEMTKNQLTAYLDYLNTNPDHINFSIKKTLRKQAKSDTFTYNYLVNEFLRANK